MLSGVATDEEVKKLAKKFSTGELSRMMGILQSAIAGFTRSTSRRMDAELCIVNLCQPELSMDAESVNSRITRLEEMIKSGTFSFVSTPSGIDDGERPPIPNDLDAPPDQNAQPDL